jgi:hypothetical protein
VTAQSIYADIHQIAIGFGQAATASPRESERAHCLSELWR